ncbi:hypothetical protein DMB90_10835 [Raoultella planticola]|uniref:PAS domain-containing protein n=1 Tax=Raoultella planticola TaxID=575 RepID=A0A5P6A9Q7_RAOPL|nr:hypothetical protein DMB90_10835 [Raoultella planticola]
MIQTAPVALCLIDRDDGRLVFANELALDWLGRVWDSRYPTRMRWIYFLAGAARCAGGNDCATGGLRGADAVRCLCPYTLYAAGCDSVRLR